MKIQIQKKSSLCFSLFVGLFANFANAQYVVPNSMGHHKESREGQCLPSSVKSLKSKDFEALLKKNKINFTNATEQEKVAVAKGIAQIENLFGKEFPGIFNAHFKYFNNNGVWNQNNGPIHVYRGWHHDSKSNTNMLIHELGHHVGNNKNPNNPLNYSRYFSAVKERCRFSGYGSTKLNEEYAEVFTAFIMAPNLLLEQGGGCVQAYHFFKQNLHKNSNKSSTLSKCSFANR